ATLEKLHAALEKLPEDQFRRETLLPTISLIIGEDRENRGAVLWPLRVAVSGERSSPDPIEIMEVLGKKESLARIALAVKKISACRPKRPLLSVSRALGWQV